MNLQYGTCLMLSFWSLGRFTKNLPYFGRHFVRLMRTNPWMWVPVTTAWRVLGLRMEEWPPIWRVAVNKLNKQTRTADEGWSSSLGVGRGANNPSP